MTSDCRKRGKRKKTWKEFCYTSVGNELKRPERKQWNNSLTWRLGIGNVAGSFYHISGRFDNVCPGRFVYTHRGASATFRQILLSHLQQAANLLPPSAPSQKRCTH